MDDKVYHASICKPEDEAKTFYIPGVYTATDSSPTYTSCPLIRDQVGAADDLNWVVVELYNDDNTIPCWLYTQVEDTGSSTILDYDFDEATQSGFTQVEFSGVSSTAGNEGAYLVSCLLSNGSQIYQILVREKI